MHLLVISHSCSTPINQQVYAEIQRQTGWEVTLVVPREWNDEFGNRLTATTWPDFKVNLLPLSVRKNGHIILHSYKAWWRKLLCEIKPDVIYMNHEPYALATVQVCWANSQSIRVPFGFYSCQNLIKRYPPPFSWLERLVYRKSKFALPITEDVAQVIRRKNFNGRMDVCALPLDPELYHPRLKLSLPPLLRGSSEIALIGFVGRVTESKGLRTLASALAKLTDLQWRLVIVGDGDFLESFKNLMAETGLSDRAQYAGYVEHTETPRWLAAMDMLVVPSETQSNWKEQFGRVIPEALACGTPVIGSDSGEIPNLVRKSGGGLVFPERNADAFAAALRRLLKAPAERQQMAGLGRAWVEREIGLGAVARKMITVFESMKSK